MDRKEFYDFTKTAIDNVDEGIQLYWQKESSAAFFDEKKLLLQINRNLARLKSKMEFNGKLNEIKTCNHIFGYKIGYHWFCISCMKLMNREVILCK